MNSPSGYFVDANLLVLLVVGGESRDLIAKHRRLKDFSARDYDLLRGLLNAQGRFLVTPNTLTEASNLLGQHGEPERSRLFRRFRSVIQEGEEVIVNSSLAASNSAFETLGLTDAALLESAAAATPLLTMDLGLCLAAWELNPNFAVNFSQLRTI